YPVRTPAECAVLPRSESTGQTASTVAFRLGNEARPAVVSQHPVRTPAECAVLSRTESTGQTASTVAFWLALRAGPAAVSQHPVRTPAECAVLSKRIYGTDGVDGCFSACDQGWTSCSEPISGENPGGVCGSAEKGIY